MSPFPIVSRDPLFHLVFPRFTLIPLTPLDFP
nr:MAG TPA: hypothetical protein [Caudoviricetes sp.]